MFANVSQVVISLRFLRTCQIKKTFFLHDWIIMKIASYSDSEMQHIYNLIRLRKKRSHYWNIKLNMKHFSDKFYLKWLFITVRRYIIMQILCIKITYKIFQSLSLKFNFLCCKMYKRWDNRLLWKVSFWAFWVSAAQFILFVFFTEIRCIFVLFYSASEDQLDFIFHTSDSMWPLHVVHVMKPHCQPEDNWEEEESEGLAHGNSVMDCMFQYS